MSLLEQPRANGHPGAAASGQPPAAHRRIAWSGLDARFRANLETFDRRTELGQAVSEVWRASRSKLQLMERADGNFQVHSRLPDVPGWLPALTAHNQLADAEGLRQQWQGTMIATLAVAGLGLGHVVRAVVAASQKTFLDFSAPVIVLEPSLLAWAVVLHLHNWRDILDEPRVRICAGSDAWAAFDDELNNPEQVTPYVFNGGPPWPGSPTAEEVLARVQATEHTRRETQRGLYRDLCQSVAGRDRAWWARRLAPASKGKVPLTVVGVTSRFTTVLQYSMRDLLAAFERAGHRTHLFIEANQHAHFSPIRLLHEMRRLQPDLVILIDHLHREYENLFPDNIPGICWIQDRLPHLFRREAGAGVGPLEFVIGHGFPECLTEFGYPADRFLPCMIPTNPEQMRDPKERAEDIEPYRCDVMYATHASATPAELHQRYRALFQGDGVALLDAAYAALLSVIREPWFCGDYHFEGLLERAERETGIRVAAPEVRADIVNMLQGIADCSLREQTIRAAARWADESGGRFHLYGRGWEAREEFARFARGVVPHGWPLGRAFRAAKICLHAGCNPAVHQRVLDGLCAGGFFLFWDKPPDSMYDVAQAVYRFYQQRKPPLPFRLRPEMLPEPQASRYRRSMEMRGVDPVQGNDLTERRVMQLKALCELGLVHCAAQIWPQYERVVFRNAEHLPEQIEYFLNHPDERRQLADEMRAVVLERFTYDALVRDVLAFMWQNLEGRSQPLLQ